ncbi:hypothetical protein MUK42_29818 [Musa troglodytarum]|uniref:Uncharacterized protein n=1 Tax=Musa troglodytarum TaxID=320322 RepID=A0A9E7FHI8_9LILI|nr:hypothetical protein MUK42_29818 [Musa troglodytarum]
MGMEHKLIHVHEKKHWMMRDTKSWTNSSTADSNRAFPRCIPSSSSTSSKHLHRPFSSISLSVASPWTSSRSVYLLPSIQSLAVFNISRVSPRSAGGRVWPHRNGRLRLAQLERHCPWMKKSNRSFSMLPRGPSSSGLAFSSPSRPHALSSSPSPPDDAPWLMDSWRSSSDDDAERTPGSSSASISNRLILRSSCSLVPARISKSKR